MACDLEKASLNIHVIGFGYFYGYFSFISIQFELWNVKDETDK